jgi:OH-DDVA meta-cleavage compound hydrolase
MVIDAHAHVTVPETRYVYNAGLLSHRGGHRRGSVGATDEDTLKALNAPNVTQGVAA